MKASARIIVTATTLAALTMLGLAATATASVPQRDEGPQHPTTTVEHATVAPTGHGAQVDREDDAPATASQLPTDGAATAPAGGGRQLAPALAVTLLSLLLALAGATWLRLRHRPREAI